jgi:hypothetical protein
MNFSCFLSVVHALSVSCLMYATFMMVGSGRNVRVRLFFIAGK